MTSSRNIIQLPYEQRRLLVVIPDMPIRKIRKAVSGDFGKAAATGTAVGAAVVGAAVVGVAAAPVVAPVALGAAGVAAFASAMTKLAAKSTADAAKTLKTKGTDLLAVSVAEAAQLNFPVGHPRSKVTYVGHPANPPEYFPFADFHRALFEHKVAEALRLVIALGAITVVVEHVQGWGKGLGINMGVGLPTALQTEVSASAGVQQSQGTYIMSRMTLVPSGPPAIPPDLVWLPQEPLWQEVVRARLESGLSSFDLNVRSTDDYGINGSVKTLLSKAGLELGGGFTEHQYTVWRLQGDFVEG